MAEQEFLASFGVEIDEAGVSRLQQALRDNRRLAEELAAAFDRARQAAEAFFRDLSGEKQGDGSARSAAGGTPEPSPTFLPGGTFPGVPFSLDFTRATKELNAFFKSAGKNFRLSADASGVIAAGRSALASLQGMFASAVLPLRAGVSVSGAVNSAVSAAPYLAGPATSAAYSNTRSVQAPVTIQVTANNANPQEVGRAVYDVTEQYLLRTLNSVI